MMAIWLRSARTAAMIAATLFLLSRPAVADLVYVNPEFGLWVPVPEGLQLCEVPDELLGPDGFHDHGANIFLDPEDSQICAYATPYASRLTVVGQFDNGRTFVRAPFDSALGEASLRLSRQRDRWPRGSVRVRKNL